MGGVCTEWVEAETVADCCGIDGTEGTEISAAAALAASEILFEISGRRWRGECEVTVRPCDDRCSGWPLQVLAGSGVVVQWYAAWNAWGWGYGGAWNRCCGCCGLSKVKLAGYPVRAITEVTIDGVAIDPSGYRLDQARWLTRMADAEGDAQHWPSCQRLDRELGEEGTFGVTYTYGAAPPAAGVNAAKSLACELARSCVGGDCRIPAGMTKVTRQGVTMEQGLIASYIRDGKTGLPDVDVFIAGYGGVGRLPRRPSIFSPDVAPYARPYGNAGGT